MVISVREDGVFQSILSFPMTRLKKKRYCCSVENLVCLVLLLAQIHASTAFRVAGAGVAAGFCSRSSRRKRRPPSRLHQNDAADPSSLVEITPESADISRTTSFVTPCLSSYSNRFRYSQKAVSGLSCGIDDVVRGTIGEDFHGEIDDVAVKIGSPSAVAGDTVLVSWNVTWTPPRSR